MTVLIEKFKEVLFSVLPITLIVLILNFSVTPMETPMLIRFILGAVFIIAGLSIFLSGIDIGISPLGNLMGTALAKTNKIWIIAIAGILLGFIISIAEPDLHILAGQVSFVTEGLISKLSIIIVVSLGIAAMLALGLIRIVYNIPTHILLTILYVMIFILALFTTPGFLAISFDASGATTGALTVPFILALAVGVSSLKKDSVASEQDNFGLVGISSAGAILAVMIMNIISQPGDIKGSLEYNLIQSTSIIAPFAAKLSIVAQESLLALLPIIFSLLVFQKILFKLTRRSLRKILKGLLYTYIGLVLFLVGVNAGFMEVGSMVGHSVAALNNYPIIILIGFVFGLVTILAEPAVHVLTQQIETATSGYVKRGAVLFALSIGVGSAVALSMIRIIVPEIQMWHFLLPGYLIAITMSYFVPKLFVGMAFDSGGVASGPMTATFILAFTQGAADAIEGANVLIEGFGMIAMVALMPIITLQILGFIFKMKSSKTDIKMESEEDLENA